MAPSPITSWQIDGETMEIVRDFIWGGSKITTDGDFSHGIKRHLLLGRKAMTNLDSILKSRDITLPAKVCLVKAMVFPVVMYGCERWTIKKAESQRINAFELWCWRRLLRVPWTARRSNQSILKEMRPEYSQKDWCWSWNSNTLATWCEELTRKRPPWCWERLKAGGEGDDRGWDGWMASLTWWTWVWASSRSLMDREAWSVRVHGVAKGWTWLSNWTEVNQRGISEKEWKLFLKDFHIMTIPISNSWMIDLSLFNRWWNWDAAWLFQDRFTSGCCCLVTQWCPTLCNPMDCSTPAFPVLHHLLELAQTHVHRVSDAIQPSHPLLPPCPPSLSLSQHQGLF